jgi:tRNA(Arg) A34 adenosine deaminase TadA
MKVTVWLAMLGLCLFPFLALGQASADSAQNFDYVTRDRAELVRKLVALPCGIQPTDDVKTILAKIDKFLTAYQPDPAYPDDRYAKESVRQALVSVQKGGYGIGAVIVDQQGNLLHGAHNEQLHQFRSDLHAEMTLLNDFEDNKKFRKYRHKYLCKPGLVVYSSAEPCPMCFIRLATAGVDTKYVAAGPDDGMVSRVDCLPPAWRDMAKQHQFGPGHNAPILRQLAHVLFYSYLLDNRMP